ncbi:hypothetical protein KXR87_22555 [Yokenella regensburgei]|uniref:hypothetical protein n=1 Tax=Yokenella regensburgei TaxID=158877 RepID=UPI003F141E33
MNKLHRGSLHLMTLGLQRNADNNSTNGSQGQTSNTLRNKGFKPFNLIQEIDTLQFRKECYLISPDYCSACQPILSTTK